MLRFAEAIDVKEFRDLRRVQDPRVDGTTLTCTHRQYGRLPHLDRVGLLAPILLPVFAITAGARLIAGEEEGGTLELELTGPISRRRVFAERLAALWLGVAAFVAVAAVPIVAGVAAVIAFGRRDLLA